MKAGGIKFACFLLSIFFFFLLVPFVYAEGLSGWMNLNRNTTKQYEEGKRTSEQDTFNRSFSLRLEKPVTPVISYQLNFRTSFVDLITTDSEGKITANYQRNAEPAVDLYLKNPIYNLDAGYRRSEQWSTAHMRDYGRKSTDFYYSRLNIVPYEFPTFLFQVDRQKEFDYLPVRKTDTTNNKFSGTSSFKFPIKSVDLSYNVYYTKNTNETPLSTTFKTVTDNFTGLYNVGYSRSMVDGRIVASAGYQGNYSRNKNQQFSKVQGSSTFKRLLQTGFRGLGTTLQPEVDALTSTDSALKDDNFTAGITSLNLGQNGSQYNNIGIQQFSGKGIHTITIYVNKNVTADADLSSAANWKAYISNSNTVGTWTAVSIASVTVSAYDVINNIYKYEIKFASSQSALFYRLINMKTITGINDVLITEIEAYGTDDISTTGITTDVVTLFNQGLNLGLNIKATNKLSFALNYMITRVDNNPISVQDSITNLPGDLFSKSTDGQNTRMRSNITKGYGISSTWMMHRLISTTARIQKSEAYDNRKETDTSSNNYSIAFNASPLQTLNTNLSFIRAENFNFGIKQSTNDSALLNIASKLYRDVNMLTDIGMTTTTSHIASSPSSETRYIRGTLDASFTPKVFGTFTYGMNWSDSNSKTSKSDEGGVIITYRPSRLINLSGTFRISDADGNTTTSEGLLVDWLPLPAVRLNFSYQHMRAEPGPTITSTFNNYIIWYITKFMDLQFTYGLSETITTKTSKNFNVGLNLNCRFW